MEERRREMSLKRLFWRYLAIFASAVIGSGIVILSIVLMGFERGVILPANYVEQILDDSADYMQKFGSYQWIPKHCPYVVVDETKEVLYYSANFESKQEAISYFSQIRGSNSGEYIYTFTNEGATCYVGYRVKVEYNSMWMNEHLPSPITSAIVLFFLAFVVEVIIFANRYTQTVAKELTLVKEATGSIRMNQLDFPMKSTTIRELNEVLESLDHMKKELGTSLKTQWNLEEQKKQQIRALAHDIKTPLTILFGNTDLLAETDLSEEQQMYSDKIMHSAEEIENYLVTLLEVSRAQQRDSLKLKPVAIHPFLLSLKEEASVLFSKKNMELLIEEDWREGRIQADVQSLKRIFMNLLTNSMECIEDTGRILIRVQKPSLKEVQISVEDSGRGFTNQELTNALTPFYQGEESRSRKNHYGLGLSIVKDLMELHGGRMELLNSTKLGGAMVNLYFPMEM